MHHLDAAILGVVHQMVLPRNQRLRVIPRDQERVAVIACGRLRWGGVGAQTRRWGQRPTPGQRTIATGAVFCGLLP